MYCATEPRKPCRMPNTSFFEKIINQIPGFGPKRELLAFVHIPKTAGTSLVAALKKEFPAERVLNCTNVEILKAQSAREIRRDYDFVHGHFGMMDIDGKATRYATVLRDPTHRILSLYNYWRSQPLSSAVVYASGVVDPAVQLAKDLSFNDFVFSDVRRILDDIKNAQAFQLAAGNHPEGRKKLSGMSDDAVFDLAYKNLSRMQAVGTVDNMAAFEKRLNSNLNLNVSIPMHNKTKSKTVSETDLSNGTVERLNALNTIDMRLYEYVRNQN